MTDLEAPDTRESRLVRTFVTLADSLVAGYDVIDLLQTLVDEATALFDAAACGIILGPNDVRLEVIVSTSEQCRQLDSMQIHDGHGPSVDAVKTGTVVSVANTAEMAERWPTFADAASGSDYVSVHSIPLRLRGETIGSLNLFRDHEGILNDEDATAARALADVATIGVLQERAHRDSTVVKDQLQRALDSRILIEQAKGVLAKTYSLDMESAYRLLRHHARSNQTTISKVAAGVVDGTTDIALTQPLEAPQPPISAPQAHPLGPRLPNT